MTEIMELLDKEFKITVEYSKSFNVDTVKHI